MHAEIKPARMSAMHKADNPTAPEFVAYLTNNGQRAAFVTNGSAAIDPERTCQRIPRMSAFGGAGPTKIDPVSARQLDAEQLCLPS
jgi:hypothetical protein